MIYVNLLQPMMQFRLGWLIGQAAAPSPTWLDALNQMDMGKLVILMLFAIFAFIVVAHGVNEFYRMAHGIPKDSAELEGRIIALEQRIQQLEEARNPSLPR